MESSFLALLFRMKYISRWSLMHNTQTENLSQHTLECTFLTHFLATVGKTYFDKSYDADTLAMYALFHDASEILTGDLPTPIKYFNEDMHKAYTGIEAAASRELLGRLPHELKQVYNLYLNQVDISMEEKRIVKIADKLCAYIKCIHELNYGNKEFSSALASIKSEIEVLRYESEELAYFLKHCLPSFFLSLDDLKVKL